MIVTNAEPEADFLTALRRLRPQSEVIITDLCEENDCRRAVAQTLATFGRLDGLVNTAGVNDGVEGLRRDERRLSDRWKKPDHYLSDGAPVRQALQSKQGDHRQHRVKTALSGQNGTSGYTATKGAVLALTREWAIVIRHEGVQ